MSTVELTNPEHPKHTMTVEPTETVAICRCWHSQKFPFCDGAHREHPGRGPCVVKVGAAAATGGERGGS